MSVVDTNVELVQSTIKAKCRKCHAILHGKICFAGPPHLWLDIFGNSRCGPSHVYSKRVRR